MANHREAATNEALELAAAERHTLGVIFHHPIAHNLSWKDTLRLLTHLGSADEKVRGKYSVTIKGKRLILHKPHGKDLGAPEIAELRHYLVSAGISPEHPYGAPPAAKLASLDVVVLIDHHGAKLYRVDLASDKRAETIRPYDPHHFLHHLHHRNEQRERGQRAPEDLTYYDRIEEALRDADRIVLLCHGTGLSNAGQILAERLKKYHPRIYARTVRQVDVNTSAMTEREILACARQALEPGDGGGSSQSDALPSTKDRVK